MSTAVAFHSLVLQGAGNNAVADLKPVCLGIRSAVSRFNEKINSPDPEEGDGEANQAVPEGAPFDQAMVLLGCQTLSEVLSLRFQCLPIFNDHIINEYEALLNQNLSVEAVIAEVDKKIDYFHHQSQCIRWWQVHKKNKKPEYELYSREWGFIKADLVVAEKRLKVPFTHPQKNFENFKNIKNLIAISNDIDELFLRYSQYIDINRTKIADIKSAQYMSWWTRIMAFFCKLFGVNYQSSGYDNEETIKQHKLAIKQATFDKLVLKCYQSYLVARMQIAMMSGGLSENVSAADFKIIRDYLDTHKNLRADPDIRVQYEKWSDAFSVESVKKRIESIRANTPKSELDDLYHHLDVVLQNREKIGMEVGQYISDLGESIVAWFSHCFRRPRVSVDTSEAVLLFKRAHGIPSRGGNLVQRVQNQLKDYLDIMVGDEQDRLLSPLYESILPKRLQDYCEKCEKYRIQQCFGTGLSQLVKFKVPIHQSSIDQLKNDLELGIRFGLQPWIAQQLESFLRHFDGVSNIDGLFPFFRDVFSVLEIDGRNAYDRFLDVVESDRILGYFKSFFSEQFEKYHGSNFTKNYLDSKNRLTRDGRSLNACVDRVIKAWLDQYDGKDDSFDELFLGERNNTFETLVSYRPTSGILSATRVDGGCLGEIYWQKRRVYLVQSMIEITPRGGKDLYYHQIIHNVLGPEKASRFIATRLIELIEICHDWPLATSYQGEEDSEWSVSRNHLEMIQDMLEQDRNNIKSLIFFRLRSSLPVPTIVVLHALLKILDDPLLSQEAFATCNDYREWVRLKKTMTHDSQRLLMPEEEHGYFAMVEQFKLLCGKFESRAVALKVLDEKGMDDYRKGPVFKSQQREVQRLDSSQVSVPQALESTHKLASSPSGIDFCAYSGRKDKTTVKGLYPFSKPH